jgi:hypothetical protein
MKTNKYAELTIKIIKEFNLGKSISIISDEVEVTSMFTTHNKSTTVSATEIVSRFKEECKISDSVIIMSDEKVISTFTSQLSLLNKISASSHYIEEVVDYSNVMLPV